MTTITQRAVVPDAVWQRIYSNIKIEIPSVTDAVLKQVVWQVVSEAMKETNIWQEEIPFPVQPNVATYTIAPADGGLINRLLIVYNPATSPQGPRFARHWAAPGITMRVPGVIEMPYMPNAADNWIAVVAKTITDPGMVENSDYPTIDPWLIEKNNDMVEYGVKARLRRMPGKTFFNIALSNDDMAHFRALKSRARANDERGNVYDGQTWTYPQGWASVTRKGWA